MSSILNKQARDILAHIQDYGFITSQQCANIYYKGNKQGLTQSQRKLKALYEAKLIERYKNKLTNKFVYTECKTSSISEHDMIIMDLYSYIYNKYNVEYFKKEEKWIETKRRSDGHIIFERNGMLVAFLIEVDLYHKTSQQKLDDMFNGGEIHQWYKDNYGEEVYPDILIINATGATKIKSDEYNVLCLNYEFSDIDNII